MLISTYVDGPIIGLNDGFIMIGEPVIIANLVSGFPGGMIGLTILDDFDDEDCDLYEADNIDEPGYFACKESFLLLPPFLLVCW